MRVKIRLSKKLRRRYGRLLAAHLSKADRLAAGLRALPSAAKPFAAAQAAWRFYDNEAVSLPVLAEPLIDAARLAVRQECRDYALVALDWSLLHFNHHPSKVDRVELAHRQDVGYKLLTALAISDVDGRPLAPVCLELEAADGLHTTREKEPQKTLSPLDGLTPVLAYVSGLKLGRPTVAIIDREADSIQHLRAWAADRQLFIVRANDSPRVRHDGRVQPLREVARQVPLARTQEVRHKGVLATQFVGETHVVIERPARTHRVRDGQKQHHNIAGPPLALRLIVSEIRDAHGTVLARWLLLSNLPMDIPAESIALWYYWRWDIESYHKLLKQAGQHLESWQQDDAEQLARRLAVAAMAIVLVWRLAGDARPEAAEMRQILVSLSGRQIKRGRGHPAFTKPALLAGLGILLPMLHLLEQYSPEELKRLARQVVPGTWQLSGCETG
ncbi:MAG TPA: transposase [Planctomycetota bacterium]|jgi:hypothetical protein